MKKLNKKNQKGFTLVELLVVIAIIGILAIVAVPALFKNIEKSKVSDLEADISAIRSASLSYYADQSEYPQGNIINNGTLVTDESNKLKGEIEGLGNPFKATRYKLETIGKDLVLTIVKEENDKTDLSRTQGNDPTLLELMSSDAYTKLEKDLGKDKFVQGDNGSKNNKVRIVIIDEDGDGTTDPQTQSK